jgi:O-antigen ligase
MTSEELFDRSGPVLLGALAPAACLAVDPAGWYPFGPVKWLLVTVVACAGAAATLRWRSPAVPRPLGLALGAWLAWLAVAAAVGLDPSYAWLGTPERHLGVLTWALCALLLVAGTVVATGGAVATLLVGLVAAGLGVGGVATLEAAGWEPAVLDVGTRLSGTFGSAAYLGAASALLLPVCVGIAGDARLAARLRTAAGVASVLLVVACVGSGARAAWVGLAVAAGAAAWARRRWLGAHRRQAGLGLAGLTVVGVALVVLSPAGARLSSLTDPDAPGGRGRLDEWRVASRVVADHPVTGVGPEGYRIAFSTAVDDRYERAHGREQQPDRAHSAPLDVALMAGLPGLVAWLTVLVLVGRRVLGALRDGPTWLTGVAAGLLAHVAGQLLLFPLAELEPVAWLLAGVVVATVDGRDRGPTRPTRPGSTAHRAVVAALGALAILATVAGVTDVVADRRAGSAADALARGDHRAGARAALDAVALRPDIVRLHVLAAAAVVADEQGTLAGIRQLEDALEVSPGDPIVLLARVRLLVERASATRVPAHSAAARAEVDRLLRRDPSSAALWSVARDLALVEGDDAAAELAAARLRTLAPTGGAP